MRASLAVWFEERRLEESGKRQACLAIITMTRPLFSRVSAPSPGKRIPKPGRALRDLIHAGPQYLCEICGASPARVVLDQTSLRGAALLIEAKAIVRLDRRRPAGTRYDRADQKRRELRPVTPDRSGAGAARPGRLANRLPGRSPAQRHDLARTGPRRSSKRNRFRRANRPQSRGGPAPSCRQHSGPRGGQATRRARP